MVTAPTTRYLETAYQTAGMVSARHARTTQSNQPRERQCVVLLFLMHGRKHWSPTAAVCVAIHSPLRVERTVQEAWDSVGLHMVNMLVQNARITALLAPHILDQFAATDVATTAQILMPWAAHNRVGKLLKTVLKIALACRKVSGVTRSAKTCAKDLAIQNYKKNVDQNAPQLAPAYLAQAFALNGVPRNAIEGATVKIATGIAQRIAPLVVNATYNS